MKPAAVEGPPKSSRTSIVDQFAQNSQVDNRGDIEFSLLNDLVNAFASSPVMARRAMRELLSRSPAKFYSSALNILKSGDAGPGSDYLNSLLLENDLLLAALADPMAFNLQTAVTLAKNLYRMDPQFDAKLLKQVLRDDTTEQSQCDLVALERVLELVDAVSDGKRLVPILMKLQRHEDARIRSKVALLLVRAHRNAEWLSVQLGNADPRLRANAIEGMLDARPGEKEIAMLWDATEDSHHRVSTTALLVLTKNGHDKAAEQLRHLAVHSSELMRSAAAWAMGMSGKMEFLEVVQKMARADTGAARRMALKASVMLRKNAPAPVTEPEVKVPDEEQEIV